MFTLIALAVGTTMISGLFMFSQSFMQDAGGKRRTTQLRYLAEGGIVLAEADLRTRGNSGDFSTVTLSGHLTATDHVNAGLTVGVRDQIKPRFTQQGHSNTEVNVYYFPSNDNGDPNGTVAYNQYFPKSYRVISEAVFPSTGQKLTIETMIYLQREVIADISYGILSDELPPGASYFDVSVARTWMFGRIHFGLPPKKLRLWGIGTVTIPYTGLVTFSHPTPANMEHPFVWNSSTGFVFEKGYLDDHPIDLSIDDVYNDALNVATVNLDTLGLSDVCLKANCDGTTDRYLCNTNPSEAVYATKRYLGETTDTVGSVVQQWSGDQVFACPGCNIHFKGCYKSNLSLIAENVVIEGDIVNYDQSDSSPYKAGIIARNDVIVPVGVPYHVFHYFRYQPSVLSEPLLNITNFVAPTPDRDTGDTTYHNHASTEGVVGEYNQWDILDTDVAIFAGRYLKLDGISNWGEFTEPTSGYMVTGKDGSRWDGSASATSGNPQSYYYEDPPGSGTIKRRVEPLVCVDNIAEGDSCPLGREGVRPKMMGWRNYGAIIMNKGAGLRGYYSETCCQGFWINHFFADPRFSNSAPLGFPQSSTIITQRLWTKEYSGRSELLP